MCGRIPPGVVEAPPWRYGGLAGPNAPPGAGSTARKHGVAQERMGPLTFKPQPSRRRQVLGAALLVSVALHLLLWSGAERLTPTRLRGTHRSAVEISFVHMPQSATHDADKPLPGPVDTPPKPAAPTRRLVSLPPPAQAQRPKDAKYDSEFDRTVEKETITRQVDKDADAAHTVQKEKLAAQAAQAAAAVEEEASLGLAPGEAPPPTLQLQPPQLLLAENNRGSWAAAWKSALDSSPQESGAPGDPDSDNNPDPVMEPGHRGQGYLDQAGGKSGKPDLQMGTGDEGQTGGAPVDLLDEGEEGTGVYLNTLQRRYASFFNTLTAAVRRHWRPENVLRRRPAHEMARQPARRFSRVEITLDRKGNVADVRMDRYCGADYLDDEAMRAIRAAGPFRSPPPALFEGQERFSFLFGFTVHFGRRTAPGWPFAGGQGL